MTRYSSADFGFLTIGPYNLTSVTDKLEDTIERAAIESTPFGVSYPESLPGVLKKYTLTGHDGWYDDAANSVNDALVGMAATENVMILAALGNAAPVAGVQKTCVATDGVLKTSYKRVDGVGEYIKASFEVEVSGQVDLNAKLVAPLVARGVTGTTAAAYLNWGADGAVGGRAYLVVTNVNWDTRTSLQITLQDCNTSGGVYADHTLFTAIVPATTPESTGTSEMKALTTAAINQYMGVTWTWAGGGAGAESATFAVAVVFD